MESMCGVLGGKTRFQAWTGDLKPSEHPSIVAMDRPYSMVAA